MRSGDIVQSVLSPAGAQASSIHQLWLLMLWTTTIVCVVVLGFIAMALFVFSFIIARMLTILVFGPRKDLIEMDADNRPYAIVRSALLFVTTVVLLQFFALVFQAFTPEITTPFYR